MKQIVTPVGKLNWRKRACAVLILCAATAMALPAQTLTTLHTFCRGGHQGCPDGAYPSAGLVQATDGDFYGVTGGTVFKITASGTLTTLHDFYSDTGGSSPNAALIQATNGDFYGTNTVGGADGFGTVFKITQSGALTTLYAFSCSPTACPNPTLVYPNGLVQASIGELYGTTERAGYGGGTIFKITPSGTLTTLYTFCSQTNCDAPDGEFPEGALIQAANGDLYGTTESGGTNGWGTVFKITPRGSLTTLYSFCQSEPGCTDGANPFAAVVQATNGDFFGTTYGGAGNCAYPCGGTVFKITPSGTLTTLYRFCAQSGCPDGANPRAALIQATDGNFYGTTQLGGNKTDYPCIDDEGCGTLFKITPDGTLTTLYSFTGGADGLQPYAGLIQGTDGNLYGTTYRGGDFRPPYLCDLGCGTVFSLSVGLGPFVETQTTSGKVGAIVRILGNNLTGTTSVTFNGTPAAFTVNSSGASILTNVPPGATSGPVQVVTPSGTLSSNLPFRVP